MDKQAEKVAREMLGWWNEGCALHADHPASQQPEQWALGPVIESRDSDLIDKVNVRALLDALKERADLEGQWMIARMGHWAVGWVEHLSMRVLDDAGRPTAMIAFWLQWQDKLEGYPIADEDALGEAEYEAAMANVERDGKRFVASDAPDDWADRVFAWLSAHRPSELDNRDGHGACPSDKALREALLMLGMLDAVTLADED